MKNLAELILDRAERRPRTRFGVVENPLRLCDAVEFASNAAGKFAEVGIGCGSTVALIGDTSTSYLLAWMACQLAGIRVALVNPSLPSNLLREMLAQLGGCSVFWVDREVNKEVDPAALHCDASQLDNGRLLSEGQEIRSTRGYKVLPGLSLSPEDVAGYMHTSGTTGSPKFCIQTHRYFTALGRFVADSMAISPADTVLAPLPMFHINPLGYGVIGGLVGGADILGATKFSASRFWSTVKEHGVTVVFLHSPPVAILNKATTPRDASGHRLRSVFLADEQFLEAFRIPLAYSGYGSTEGGGLSHIWTWRLGDHCTHPEGMPRYAGVSRPDIEWDLGADSEILIRERGEHLLCSGYQTADGVVGLAGEDGWFHTGDLGRREVDGSLVFIERKTESIRVKGEYVPINFVEQVFAKIDELEEVALWKQASELVDDEVLLYVVSRGALPIEKLLAKAKKLPAFMRPAAVVRIPYMPRDEGVGKVSRRQLRFVEVCERLEPSDSDYNVSPIASLGG